MGLIRNFFAWVFTNKVPGVPDAQKYVDAVRVMTNYTDIGDAIFLGRAQGVYATDNGSTPTLCKLILKTANGITGLIDDGDKFVVTDGAGRWWLGTSTADDQAEFAPADQVKGTAMGTGYDQSAFHNSLKFAYAWWLALVGKTQLILEGSHGEKIDGSVIEIGVGAAPTDKIGTVLDNTTTKLFTAHKADGTQEAGSVGADALAETALAGQSFANLVRDGDMEIAPSTISSGGAPPGVDGVVAPEGWDAFGGATSVIQSTTQVYRGDYSLELIGTLTGHSARGTMVPEFDVEQYQNKKVVIGTWVYCPDDDCAKVGYEGSSGAIFGTNVAGAAADWAYIEEAFTVGAAETVFRPLVGLAIDGARTIYVDNVQVAEGTVAADYMPSTWDNLVRGVKNVGHVQYIINKDMIYWNGGVTYPPDAWSIDALGSTIAQNFGVGNYVTLGISSDVTLVNAGSFWQCLGYLPTNATGCGDLMLDQEVTAVFWLNKVAGAGQVWSRIYSNAAGGVAQDIKAHNPPIGLWRRYYHTFRVAAGQPMAATTLSFENLDGLGNIQFLVDRVEFYISPVPLGYEVADYHKLEPITWQVIADPMGPASIWHGGLVLPIRPGRYMAPLSIHVRQASNTLGPGPNTYACTIGGIFTQSVPVAIGAAEASGYTQGAGANWFVIPSSQLECQVTAYSGYVGTAEAQVAVTFVTWDK